MYALYKEQKSCYEDKRKPFCAKIRKKKIPKALISPKSNTGDCLSQTLECQAKTFENDCSGKKTSLQLCCWWKGSLFWAQNVQIAAKSKIKKEDYWNSKAAIVWKMSGCACAKQGLTLENIFWLIRKIVPICWKHKPLFNNHKKNKETENLPCKLMETSTRILKYESNFEPNTVF